MSLHHYFFVGPDNPDPPTWYMVHIGGIGDFPVPVRIVDAIAPTDVWCGFSAIHEPGVLGPVMHMTGQTAEITMSVNLADAYRPEGL